MFKILKSIKIVLIVSLIFTLTSCSKGFFKPGDARKNPPDPKLRVKKNLEEGKGFRLNSALGGNRGELILNLQVPMNYGELHLMFWILCLLHLQIIVAV